MAQPNPSQASQVLIKPEQVDALPFLTPEQKAHYKNGFAQLWQQMETLPAGSSEQQEAQQKLRAASVKLMQQLASKNSRPGSQGRPATAGAPAQQAPAATPGTAAQAPTSQQQTRQQAMQQELASIKVNVPSTVEAQGAEAATAYRRKFLQHFMNLLQKREQTRARASQIIPNAQRMQQAGQTIPPDVQKAVAEIQQEMNNVNVEIRTLKTKNERAGMTSVEAQKQGVAPVQSAAADQPAANGAQTQPQAQAAQQQQQQQQMQAAVGAQQQQKTGEVKNAIAQQRPTQPPAQVQGKAQQQPPAAQGTAGSQQPGVAQAPGANAAQITQGATQTQQNLAQQQQNIALQQQQAQQKPPQPNQQQAQPQPMQQPSTATATPQTATQSQFPAQQLPQSAQSLGQPQGQPPQRSQPLQAALSQAAETYSQQHSQTQLQAGHPVGQQQAMGSTGGGNFQAGSVPNSAGATQTPPTAYQQTPTQNPGASNTKFPIPKTLNIDPRGQVAVPGPPSRPTLSATGMMQQPGLQKAPAFVLEGDGDRVLSKRKLDELVRQVTGGGEDGALAPDVEEAVLTLADDFVDNVITSACRLAKLRTSQTLDIRDIQIVLERNYGIRIPGYSLDETRTVRKFQPAPGWQSKMQAIQAGKVMGNKDS